MRKISYYLAAMRLRTLPLSLSGAVLGCTIALADFHPGRGVIILTLLTTILLQILSNVSNELGDMLSGTDSDDRQGPAYTLSQGKLSVADFKRMVWAYSIACAMSGLGMIFLSFGTLFCVESLTMALLGALAIRSAIKYTLGKNPYGYRGLGDLYVFLFFGLVSVVGTYFIASHDLTAWKVVLPAASIGCFSVAVLNVNNIRDMKTDAKTRVTTPLRIGATRARIYQTLLIVVGWFLMLIFSALDLSSHWLFLYVPSLPLFIIHLVGVWRLRDKALDPMLPLLVIATFSFSVLASIGYLASDCG